MSLFLLMAGCRGQGIQKTFQGIDACPVDFLCLVLQPRPNLFRVATKQSVQIVDARHVAASPVPECPFKGLGQLQQRQVVCNIGRGLSYSFGYLGFLPALLPKTGHELRNFQRGQAFSLQIFNELIFFRIIYIHTGRDCLLASHARCPKASRAVVNDIATGDIRMRTNGNRRFYPALTDGFSQFSEGFPIELRPGLIRIFIDKRKRKLHYGIHLTFTR